jgi:uncharacterized repeat protein (TIGR03809 family)
MTQQLDVARGGDVIARWCALAEARLEYLTELFETGRWRRYHSERAFLENIQEAKSAVEIWRGLSMREASRDNAAIDMSWLGRVRTTSPRGEGSRDQVHRLQPQPAETAATVEASVISIVPETDTRYPQPATPAPAMADASEPSQDLTEIAARYPLLRNAL